MEEKNNKKKTTIGKWIKWIVAIGVFYIAYFLAILLLF